RGRGGGGAGDCAELLQQSHDRGRRYRGGAQGLTMLPDFHEHPGLLFIVATLLPLLSFALLLLPHAAWALLRPYRVFASGAALYNLYVGDAGGKGAAYVALGAIALACLLCITGFVVF